MSEKMTAVRRSDRTGFKWSDWGEVPPEELIAAARRQAEYQRRQAELFLAATDDELIVETFIGPIAQRNRRQVWPVVTHD